VLSLFITLNVEEIKNVKIATRIKNVITFFTSMDWTM